MEASPQLKTPSSCLESVVLGQDYFVWRNKVELFGLYLCGNPATCSIHMIKPSTFFNKLCLLYASVFIHSNNTLSNNISKDFARKAYGRRINIRISQLSLLICKCLESSNRVKASDTTDIYFFIIWIYPQDQTLNIWMQFVFIFLRYYVIHYDLENAF